MKLQNFGSFMKEVY